MYDVLTRYIDCGLIKQNIHENNTKNHFVFLKNSDTKLYPIKIERLLYYGVFVIFFLLNLHYARSSYYTRYELFFIVPFCIGDIENKYRT